MNWTTLAAWAFGFFTPALTVAYIMGASSLMAFYFGMIEKFSLPPHSIWSGVFLFAALAVLSGVVIAQFVK